MTRLNLHIFASNIEAETRLFKEARYTLGRSIFDRVVVVGLWAEGLAEGETLSSGLEVQRVPTWVRRLRGWSVLTRRGFIWQVVASLSLLQYAASVLLRARRLKPTHVSCHNLILLPLSWIAARITGAHLVYLPHELETQRSGLGGLRKRMEIWIERQLIGRARDVVTVSPPIADWYRQVYGGDNVHVIRNLPEAASVMRKAIQSGAFRDRFAIPSAATVFIYQGVLGPERSTDVLLHIFADLPRDRCHLVLMGYGTDAVLEEIRSFAATVRNIHFQPAVPADQIVSYSSGADIGIWINETAPLSYRYALPNKFYEYAHAGLPVLVSDNLSYLAQLIEEADIGWVTRFQDARATIESVSLENIEAMRERVAHYAERATWEADAALFSYIYR